MRLKRMAPVLAFSLTLSVMLSGCGFLNTSKSIDPPPDQINYVKNGESLDNAKGKAKAGGVSKATNSEATKTVKRELYLLDDKGRVAPQVLEIPNDKAVAKQALEYLVKDGPVENLLPNGFQAVLPAGTVVNSVNLTEKGTLVADFSKDILNYQPSQEEQILQALTWTVTQFNNINKLKVRINGVDQDVMPVAKTPIGNGLTRANGINNEMGDVVDVTGSDSATLYFLAQHQDEYYYVPVTRRISRDEGDLAGVVDGLIKGPSSDSGLLSVLGSDVELVSEPVVKDGVVTLDFNKGILTDKDSKTISDQALNAIVLTLTSQKGIEKVSIRVDGIKEVMNESGKSLAKPVSKPDLNITGI